MTIFDFGKNHLDELLKQVAKDQARGIEELLRMHGSAEWKDPYNGQTTVFGGTVRADPTMEPGTFQIKTENVPFSTQPAPEVSDAERAAAHERLSKLMAEAAKRVAEDIITGAKNAGPRYGIPHSFDFMDQREPACHCFARPPYICRCGPAPRKANDGVIEGEYRVLEDEPPGMPHSPVSPMLLAAPGPEYVCAACNKTFIGTISVDAAKAERGRAFGEPWRADDVLICDDCWERGQTLGG